MKYQLGGGEQTLRGSDKGNCSWPENRSVPISMYFLHTAYLSTLMMEATNSELLPN